MTRKEAESSGRIRVGIGGWSYAPWRGVFYPKGLKQADELAYAGSRLTSIEIAPCGRSNHLYLKVFFSWPLKPC